MLAHWKAKGLDFTRIFHKELAGAMGDYWASFARSGRPQAEGQPDWPDYSDDAGFLHIVEAPKAGHRLLPGTAALHEAVMCRRRAAGDIAGNWNVGVISPPLPPLPPKAAGCQ